jgi:hypothetical protein
MQKYTVRTSCEIAGVWRNAGDEIVLDEAQARELAPPFGNVIAPVAAAKTERPAAATHNRAVITEGPKNGGFERNKRTPRGGVK